MEGLLRVSTYIIPVQTSLPPSFKLSQMEPEFVKKQSVSKSEKNQQASQDYQHDF